MKLFNSLVNLLSTSRTVRRYPNLITKGRTLRVEALEERRMLSVEACCSSSVGEIACFDQVSSYVSESLYTENLLDSTLNSVLLATSMQTDTDSSFPKASEVGDSIEENDPFFEKYGVYFNGMKYVSITDLQYLPNGSDNSISDNAILNEESPDFYEDIQLRERDELDEYTLEVTIDTSGCSGIQPDLNGFYQLHEGHGSLLSFPGSLADPESIDYMTVTLPALPYGYESTVTFTGSATLGSDYIVYIPYSVNTVSGNRIHGDSEEIFVVRIVDDRLFESAESFTITLGIPQMKPWCVTQYDFNYICMSANGIILDNDGWDVGVVQSNVYIPGNPTIYETNATQIDLHVARIPKGFGLGGDIHYPIDATIQITGSATYSSDYLLYLNTGNNNLTPITPSQGCFVVRIPENADYAVITVKAIDDFFPEFEAETIIFTVVEAIGYPPIYTYGASEDSLTVYIEDNDSSYLNNSPNSLNFMPDTLETKLQNTVYCRANNSLSSTPVEDDGDTTLTNGVSVSGNRDYSQAYQIRRKWNRGLLMGNDSDVYSKWTTVNNTFLNIGEEINLNELPVIPDSYFVVS
ncbi:MAG: hypothetical protein IK077_05795 [Thermoguttaceae bacterium]|nr:hypothetical protein [Thermoguttaceae bacterium]